MMGTPVSYSTQSILLIFLRKENLFSKIFNSWLMPQLSKLFAMFYLGISTHEVKYLLKSIPEWYNNSYNYKYVV